jgi:DNA invertase Pin-like site-specific DNA recombinase
MPSEQCVVYVRVSTERQSEEGYSQEAQENIADEYCQRKGLVIYQKFITAESAKEAGRKDFNIMIKLARQKKIKHLVFEKVDRMLRNIHDLQVIYDLMNEGHVIHSIKNGLVMDKDSRSQEKLQLDLNAILCKNYSENLAEETKKGGMVRLKDGYHIQRLPRGYTVDPVSGIGKPNQEALRIKRVFNDYLAGVPMQNIFKITGYSKSTVLYILKNIYYAGRVHGYGQSFPGKHQGLITEAEYFRVQERLKGRTSKVMSKHVYRFTGLIRCSCSHAFIGSTKKGKYVYYECSSRLKTRGSCKNAGISELRLMEEATKILQQIHFSDDTLAQIRVAVNEFLGSSRSYQQAEKKQLEAKSREIDTMIINTENMLAQGKLSPDTAGKMLDRYKADQDTIIEQIKAHRNVDIDTHLEALAWVETINNLAGMLNTTSTPENYNDFLKSLIRNYVWDGKKLSVAWSELMEAVLEIERAAKLAPQTVQNTKLFEATWNHFITLFQIDIIKKEKIA